MSSLFEARAADGLDQLGLSVARAHLDGAAQRAATEGGGNFIHFLGYLLDGELTERHRKRVELNLQFARFPTIKRLDHTGRGSELDSLDSVSLFSLLEMVRKADSCMVRVGTDLVH